MAAEDRDINHVLANGRNVNGNLPAKPEVRGPMHFAVHSVGP